MSCLARLTPPYLGRASLLANQKTSASLSAPGTIARRSKPFALRVATAIQLGRSEGASEGDQRGGSGGLKPPDKVVPHPTRPCSHSLTPVHSANIVNLLCHRPNISYHPKSRVDASSHLLSHVTIDPPATCGGWTLFSTTPTLPIYLRALRSSPVCFHHVQHHLRMTC